MNDKKAKKLIEDEFVNIFAERFGIDANDTEAMEILRAVVLRGCGKDEGQKG